MPAAASAVVPARKDASPSRDRLTTLARLATIGERANVMATMRTSLPQCEILPVDEEHLPALAKLAGVIWRACYPEVISREQIEYMLARMYALDTLRDELRFHSIRFYRLIVAGEFSGFASMGPDDVPRVMKLHKLYLLPAWHDHGLGSRLLEHCQTEARRLGARRLILAVNKRNRRAISAYRRNGFAIVEAVVTDIGGGFVMDDFIMAKALALL